MWTLSGRMNTWLRQTDSFYKNESFRSSLIKKGWNAPENSCLYNRPKHDTRMTKMTNNETINVLRSSWIFYWISWCFWNALKSCLKMTWTLENDEKLKRWCLKWQKIWKNARCKNPKKGKIILDRLLNVRVLSDHWAANASSTQTSQND